MLDGALKELNSVGALFLGAFRQVTWNGTNFGDLNAMVA